jgi:Protein of unknown function (DUF1044).
MTMHTVIETPEYLQDAKDAGLSGDAMAAIIQIIASDPKAGDVMVGTGGARKLRFAASGKGKRGGVRTVHYFGGDDVPVFMLAVIKKGDRDNLSKAECNALRKELQGIADAYRKSVKVRAAKRRVKF